MGLMEDLGIKRLNPGESIEVLIPKELIERSRKNIAKERERR